MAEKKFYLEISLEKDKRDVAAILVANGYCVKIETVGTGRGKRVLAIWKDEEKKKS